MTGSPAKKSKRRKRKRKREKGTCVVEIHQPVSLDRLCWKVRFPEGYHLPKPKKGNLSTARIYFLFFLLFWCKLGVTFECSSAKTRQERKAASSTTRLRQRSPNITAKKSLAGDLTRTWQGPEYQEKEGERRTLRGKLTTLTSSSPFCFIEVVSSPKRKWQAMPGIFDDFSLTSKKFLGSSFSFRFFFLLSYFPSSSKRFFLLRSCTLRQTLKIKEDKNSDKWLEGRLQNPSTKMLSLGRAHSILQHQPQHHLASSAVSSCIPSDRSSTSCLFCSRRNSRKNI